MTLKKIDHIAIAVRDLDQSVGLYGSLLRAKPTHVEDLVHHKVRAAFFQVGESDIELLMPMAADSPVSSFLDKNGDGIHHVCFQVDDIEEELRRLKSEGFRLIDEVPRPGAHGKRIAFVHPKSMGGVLIELSEIKDQK